MEGVEGFGVVIVVVFAIIRAVACIVRNVASLGCRGNLRWGDTDQQQNAESGHSDTSSGHSQDYSKQQELDQWEQDSVSEDQHLHSDSTNHANLLERTAPAHILLQRVQKARTQTKEVLEKVQEGHKKDR